jgi:hypothetical protein
MKIRYLVIAVVVLVAGGIMFVGTHNRERFGGQLNGFTTAIRDDQQTPEYPA